MLIAVCAGISGRLQELLDRMARWSGESGRFADAIVALGDLPLHHDFSRFTGPATADTGTSVDLIADLVHGRVERILPIIILPGEKDDPTLLDRFKPRVSTRGVDPEWILEQSTGLPKTRGGGARQFYTLESGQRVFLATAAEKITVAGFSLYRPSTNTTGPNRSNRSFATARRADSRRLLSMEPGSVDVLFSHDNPGEPLEDALHGGEFGDSEGAGPAILLVKAIHALQPRIVIYGHARSVTRLRVGKTLLIGLPPWSPPGGPAPVALLNTKDGSVVIMSSGRKANHG